MSAFVENIDDEGVSLGSMQEIHHDRNIEMNDE